VEGPARGDVEDVGCDWFGDIDSSLPMVNSLACSGREQ